MPETPSHTFSEEQSAVFAARPDKIRWQVHADWMDLYALLGVREQAHPREIDEAIVGRSAECLQFAFSRGAGSEFIATVEKHLPEFRRVLLHEKQRERYDELLRKHRAGEPAMTYDEFVESLPADTSAAGCLTVVAWFVLGGAGLAQCLPLIRG